MQLISSCANRTYPIEIVAKILAPPIWNSIDRMNEKEKKLLTALRMVYGLC